MTVTSSPLHELGLEKRARNQHSMCLTIARLQRLSGYFPSALMSNHIANRLRSREEHISHHCQCVPQLSKYSSRLRIVENDIWEPLLRIKSLHHLLRQYPTRLRCVQGADCLHYTDKKQVEGQSRSSSGSTLFVSTNKSFSQRSVRHWPAICIIDHGL